MPYANRAIFRTRNHHRKLWVKTYGGNVMRMSIECLHTTFRLEIPNFDKLIVGTRNKVWPLTTAEIFNAVYPLFVSFKGEVRAILPDRPYLNGSIKRGRSESVCVFWIKHGLHHIMGMPFEHLFTCPVVFPIPEFNKHVIRTC